MMNDIHTKKGFTLIEIMVSIAVFAIIMTVGMGAVVSILNTYNISKQEKQVYESLNYSIESMTREMRLGQNFNADCSGISCSGSVENALPSRNVSSIGFSAANNRGYVRLFLEDGVIYSERAGAVIPGTNTADTKLNGIRALTNREQVEITQLRFSVYGTAPRSSFDYLQPLVWMQIQAKANIPGQERISTIQTFISQRALDIN